MATLKQKDIKLLWGRSGNRCSICKVELTQDASTAASTYTLGEQAHIVGEKEDAARGKSILNSDQRNSYHNLILLCPNDHTMIDSNEIDWPVEKLHQVKSEHELWVNETLSKTSDQRQIAQQVAVSSIIDCAVELCGLDEWHDWTSFTLGADPVWEKTRPEKIRQFRHRVIAAIWPEQLEELKRATTTFSILIKKAVDTYMLHSELKGDHYVPYKFYKRRGEYNENYDSDVVAYESWLEDCFDSMIQATKAANWFADVVRKDINPMFFAEKGKFLIQEGFFSDLAYRTSLREFTEDEKMIFL